MDILGSIAGPLIGGLLGNEGQQQTQTQQNKIDPRMDPYVYGNGGVLPSASSWYQSNASGLNPQMLTGMNNQWSQLGASAPGYQHMQNLGLSLMGGGVAGNPFTGGNMASGGGASAGPYQVPQMSPGPFTMPAQMPAASMRPGHEAPENDIWSLCR